VVEHHVGKGHGSLLSPPMSNGHTKPI
jgi:hypothetical protein